MKQLLSKHKLPLFENDLDCFLINSVGLFQVLTVVSAFTCSKNVGGGVSDIGNTQFWKRGNVVKEAWGRFSGFFWSFKYLTFNLL